MTMKRWIKEIPIKKLVKMLIFISIANLPFLTITENIGIDTFIDSFENPDYYFSIENEFFGSKTSNDNYIIIQKSSHPDFELKEKDLILFFNDDGDLVYNTINGITKICGINKYSIGDENTLGKSIYRDQIVGKVIKNIDNNIWNLISVKIWEASINNLNIELLIPD